MATLENLVNTAGNYTGDYNTYKQVKDKGLVLLDQGRRGAHTFTVKSNVRTLRSGPNRGKIRVDGLTLVVYGNHDPACTQAAVVRRGDRLLSTLDALIKRVNYLDAR